MDPVARAPGGGLVPRLAVQEEGLVVATVEAHVRHGRVPHVRPPALVPALLHGLRTVLAVPVAPHIGRVERLERGVLLRQQPRLGRTTIRGGEPNQGGTTIRGGEPNLLSLLNCRAKSACSSRGCAELWVVQHARAVWVTNISS